MRTRVFSIIGLFLTTCTMHAQEDCGNLMPEILGYSPFDSGVIEVRLLNSGEIGWSYPSLILYNEGGDTLAWAPADFFALASGSIFSLPITGPAPVPQGAFMGRLELWTGFNENLSCFWHLNGVLCPPDSCVEVLPFAFVNVVPTGPVELPWSITDENGALVAGGTMVMDTNITSATDTVCLTPGIYSMTMTASGVSEEHVYYQVLGTAWNTSSSPQVQMSEQDESPFVMLGACTDEDNAVAELQNGTLHARIVGNEIIIERDADDRSAGTARVFDAAGRLLKRSAVRSDVIRINLSDLPDGLLIVTLSDEDGTRSGRVIWMR